MIHETKTANWNNVKRKIKVKFTKFNDAELEGLNGHLDQLPGKVQKLYGYDKKRAEYECKEFNKYS